jgi:hypothetical protein
MRLGSNIAVLAGLASMAFSGPVLSPPIGDSPAEGITPSRKQKGGKGQNNRRGKGFQAKPKKHSNRLTISKRIRRKHRRAA